MLVHSRKSACGYQTPAPQKSERDWQDSLIASRRPHPAWHLQSAATIGQAAVQLMRETTQCLGFGERAPPRRPEAVSLDQEIGDQDAQSLRLRKLRAVAPRPVLKQPASIGLLED